MDQLFLKRLDPKHWLALRMPKTLSIAVNSGNELTVSKPWNLEALPHLKWDPPTEPKYYVPCFEEIKEGDKKGAFGLAWAERPAEQLVGGAYAGVIAEVQKRHEEKGGLDRILENLHKLAAPDSPSTLSLPLRAYRAYIGIESSRDEEKATKRWIAQCIDALATRPGELPIEAFGGLLFIIVSSGEPSAGNPADLVYIDKMSLAEPEGLHLKAFQSSTGVLFEISDANGAAYTNESIAGLLNHPEPAPRLSGYYRLTRTLGIVERPSRRSGLIAIPTRFEEPASPESVQPVPWNARRFRPSDRLAPDELIGELLNYRLELINPHGTVIKVGRHMLQRMRLDPPAAPARAAARLVRKEASTKLTIRFDLPPTESNSRNLTIQLYELDNAVLPTGFYGDADDAAVRVARLLSDIDPAAVADGRASDQLPPGSASEASQPSLSNHGLKPLLGKDGKGMSDAKRVPSSSGESHPWNQFQWELPIDDLDGIIAPGRAVRLFLALRRTLPGDSSVVHAGPSPESPVLELQMSLGFGDDPESDLAVPHFERFWDVPVDVGEPFLDRDRVFITEAPQEPSAGTWQPAVIRVQVQHLTAANAVGQAGLVGGYRLWMRDLPARHAGGMPFEEIALVQAVPQLVKAYAPIEVGRQWWMEQPSEDPGKTDGALPNGFLVRPVRNVSTNPNAETNPVAVAAAATAAGAAALAIELKTALSDPSVHPKDPHRAGLLFQIWDRLAPTDCDEVILNVEQRRALLRASSLQVWLKDYGGSANWILFRDQNGGYLGRAWIFRGALAAQLSRIYVLREIPNLHDTVPIDDFGQLTWNWAGLRDGWHHEMEWLVEPLSRYAPLRGRKASPPSSKDKRLVTPALLQPSGTIDDASIHRHAVQRREPFSDRQIRLVAATGPDTPDDAFVWKVLLPADFQRAAHNTHARTALGVLRIEVLQAQVQALLGKHYRTDSMQHRLLIQHWCGDDGEPAVSPEPTLERVEEGHEIVVHQPACFKVTLEVRPSADGKKGLSSRVEGAEREPRAFRYIDERDRCFMTLSRMVLVLPLARLAWSYRGPARPTVRDVLGEGHTNLTTKPDVAELQGLRLPDPHVSATVYVLDDGVLYPCVHFFGLAAEDTTVEMQAHWKRVPDTGLWWGTAYCDTERIDEVDLGPGGDRPGKLMIKLLNKVEPEQVRVLWKRKGESAWVTPLDHEP